MTRGSFVTFDLKVEKDNYYMFLAKKNIFVQKQQEEQQKMGQVSEAHLVMLRSTTLKFLKIYCKEQKEKVLAILLTSLI